MTTPYYWITPYARDWLYNPKYPTVSVEERLGEIAARAETLLKESAGHVREVMDVFDRM